MYILWYCCMHFFFFFFFMPSCLRDLTSRMVRKSKENYLLKLHALHLIVQWSLFKLLFHSLERYRHWCSKTHTPVEEKHAFLCTTKHSSPFTDAAGKSVSPLSQKTVWKPTSSLLFNQEGILPCFEFTMNFMDQGERKMLQGEDIHHGSFLNLKLLFASFCTVICFRFGLIIPLDNIFFQKMMKDKRRLLHSYFRTSLNYYGL